MALSSDKIEAIRERVDIVRVIGARVTLKKQGQRYSGLCPFHDEKTPSFSVSPDKGLFYCFGCHAGGDVFAFLMRHEGLDFHAAARRLGGEVGVELEPDSPARAAARRAEEEIVRANTYALAFFQHELWAAGGRAARGYLVERGVPEVLAREWRLGFGGETSALFAYFDSKKVPRAFARRAGLLNEDGSRSLFEGRLVFPVADGLGRLAGFGGRRLGDGGAPKYVNTRETPLFAKRRLLFGWEHAESAIRKSRRVVLVEGYMDVLACHASGVPEAVAALGTAFTDEHARLAARLAKEAVVMLDGDDAGRAASFKAAQKLVATKLVTLVAALPAGRDPDGLWREQGPAALGRAVTSARPAVEHFIELAFADTTLAVEAKASAARDVWPLIDALGTGLERDLYTARLAERVGVAVEQLTRHMNSSPAARAGRRADPPPAAPVRGPGTAPAMDAAEIAMLRELLLYPELRPRLSELIEYAMAPVMRGILEELAATQDDVGAVCARHAGGDRRVLELAAIKPAVGLDEAAEKAARTYRDVLTRMKARHVDAALRDVLRELSEIEARGGDPGELVQKQRDLRRRKRALLRGRHPT